MNYYIEKGYAKKLTENELPKTSPITSWSSELKKTNKFRVVFDTAGIYHETNLHYNLLAGIDPLNNLVSLFYRF